MNITLAEALLERANLEKEIQMLQDRLLNNLLIQEGDKPSLDPLDLKDKIFKNLEGISSLVARINRTNNATRFNKDMSLMEALALRDQLQRKRNILDDMVANSSISNTRYSAAEIRFINVLELEDIQKRLDLISKELRQLDTDIQKLNWRTDLLD